MLQVPHLAHFSSQAMGRKQSEAYQVVRDLPLGFSNRLLGQFRQKILRLFQNRCYIQKTWEAKSVTTRTN